MLLRHVNVMDLSVVWTLILLKILHCLVEGEKNHGNGILIFREKLFELKHAYGHNLKFSFRLFHISFCDDNYSFCMRLY